MKKIYALFEGSKIVKISDNKAELVKHFNSLPEDVRRYMVIAEKTVISKKTS